MAPGAERHVKTLHNVVWTHEIREDIPQKRSEWSRSSGRKAWSDSKCHHAPRKVDCCCAPSRYVAFTTEVRNQGYSGDVRKLFKQLDPLERGCVAMHDFAKEEHEVLRAFKKHLREKFGGVLKGPPRQMDWKTPRYQ